MKDDREEDDERLCVVASRIPASRATANMHKNSPQTLESGSW